MILTVADRLALADVVHSYAALVDDRRFDDVVELFTDAAELKVPDPPHTLEPVRRHSGRGGVRAALSSLAAVARTQHAIVGEVYSGGPGTDDALGRIACIAHHWSYQREQVTDLVWHLRYDDEYQLTDAGWRIRSRALTINAVETRPVRRLRSGD
jgi:3-phenylpropionate/cinnamic acid dioxygenase small subunit